MTQVGFARTPARCLTQGHLSTHPARRWARRQCGLLPPPRAHPGFPREQGQTGGQGADLGSRECSPILQSQAHPLLPLAPPSTHAHVHRWTCTHGEMPPVQGFMRTARLLSQGGRRVEANLSPTEKGCGVGDRIVETPEHRKQGEGQRWGKQRKTWRKGSSTEKAGRTRAPHPHSGGHQGLVGGACSSYCPAPR